jgi:methylenetetrahydrofolate--tRNA-(uracil-5-)-methyltransferase
MNINHGLLPPIEAPGSDVDGKRLKGKERGRAKKRAVAVRALQDVDRWLAEQVAGQAAAE